MIKKIKYLHFIYLAAASALVVMLGVVSPAFAVDPSLMPMYGGVAKTAAQKKSDADFIAAVVKIAGSPEKASEQLVNKGFTALTAGDADSAMRRFNQAYLLTPNSAEVRWGLAAGCAARGLFDDSFKLFEALNKSQPANVRLLNDFAFARINKALSIPEKDQAFEQLNRAKLLLNQAAIVDSTFDRTYFNLATIEFYQGEYESAWKDVALCERFGGQSLNPRFVQDLSKAMPRPN